ncbi:hypothetical protein H5410_001927 [Solanum commersonii]|uniref:Uncharacterized protein n=1 Tax=Solanum commersonii TaxID=4109 RepID=A0A9J6B0Y0_SOLCO|nr:hypothetical protein H5410_001927 [Solanum commersonii]
MPLHERRIYGFVRPSGCKHRKNGIVNAKLVNQCKHQHVQKARAKECTLDTNLQKHPSPIPLNCHHKCIQQTKSG